MLDFSHVGVRGVWLNVQLDLRLGIKFCSGVSKNDDFRHVDMGGRKREGDSPLMTISKGYGTRQKSAW